jgi:hypothetical protein
VTDSTRHTKRYARQGSKLYNSEEVQTLIPDASVIPLGHRRLFFREYIWRVTELTVSGATFTAHPFGAQREYHTAHDKMSA